MKALDAAAVGVVLTVAVQAPGSYQALTSAVVGIRSHSAGGGDMRDIRDAEVISAVVVLLVGAAGTLITRSPVPFVAAVAADAVMVGVYEYAMRTCHNYPAGGSFGASGTGAADSY